jgi:hypothetical protein
MAAVKSPRWLERLGQAAQALEAAAVMGRDVLRSMRSAQQTTDPEAVAAELLAALESAAELASLADRAKRQLVIAVVAAEMSVAE